MKNFINNIIKYFKKKKLIEEKINLTKGEIKLIKLCKGHFSKNKWPPSKISDFIPVFTEMYGWDPLIDNNYDDFLDCLFYALLNIHNKIGEEDLAKIEIKELFREIFKKQNSNNSLESGILKLKSIIAFTKVKNRTDKKIIEL
jgi:hypothetical protein